MSIHIVKPQNTLRLYLSGQVQDWFDFAQDNVPELTKRYLGHQQFLSSSGQGTSFPLLPVKE